MAPSWQPNLLCGTELSRERQIGQNLAIILNLPLPGTKPDKACGGLKRAFELYNNINYSTNNSVNEWGCVCPHFTEQMPGHLSNICSLTVTWLYVGKTHECLTSFWTDTEAQRVTACLGISCRAGISSLWAQAPSEACSLFSSMSIPWLGD